MDTYLNPKKNAKKKGEAIIAVVCALMAVSSATILMEYIASGEWDMVAIDVCLIALFAWGVYRYAERMLSRRAARRIAHTLEQLSDERLTFAKLEALLPQCKAPAKIKRLLDKGYLQNMYMDWQQSLLYLSVSGQQNAAYVQVICPNCGAKNRVLAGRTAHCEYCEQLLSGEAEE